MTWGRFDQVHHLNTGRFRLTIGVFSARHVRDAARFRFA